MTPLDPTIRSDSATPPPDVERLRRPLDAVAVGALLLDTEGRVLHVNRVEAAEGLLTEGGDLFRDLLPQLERDGHGERFREQAAAGPVDLRARIQLPGASGDRSLELVFRDVPGEPGVVVATMADRTAVEREEERRKRSERLASVGELAAGVAHEVNNPLASIKSFAQLLSSDATSDAQREALEIIISESTRVAEVVGDLLSYARQQGASDREPVILNSIAERVLGMQRYALETAGIEVRRDFDASLSPVMGEAGALQQVMLNLVVNAEQALATKSGHRLLIVRTRESSEGVILSIVDNGPGIPRNLLPSIFDPFRTTKSEGTGLGLGISAAIVRDHSGQIWAESEAGRGAAFFIRLPRFAAEAPSISAPAASAKPTPLPTAKRSLRVLVADDEPTLRLALSLFLQRRGHQVAQASHAEEAIRLARAGAFDVALVDARMPGDGLALLEKLEAMPALQGRTALMTGDIGRARTSQGITTGRPCLTKPFDMEEMVRLVETLGR